MPWQIFEFFIIVFLGHLYTDLDDLPDKTMTICNHFTKMTDEALRKIMLYGLKTLDCKKRQRKKI